MALTETRPDTDRGTAATEPGGPTRIEQLIGTGDHLTIGRLYIGFSLVFGALAAVGLALWGLDGIREDGLLGLVGSLGLSSVVALVVTGALPLLLGLAIYIVPRQVGSPAIAFPRAAAASLWTWVLATGLFWVSVALGGGIGGTDVDGARMGNLSFGAILVALGMATVCVATTVLSHRPLGMGLARVPFFSWSMLVAAPVWILSFGSAVAHVFVGQISQAGAAGLAEGFDAGIAWMLRVPAVYLLAIPVLGLAADVVAMASGQRIRAYGVVQGCIGAYAVLSFGAWTQTPGATQTVVWVAAVVLAALPVLALLGGLADTLRRGRLRLSAALLGTLLAPLLVLGGVLAGALAALDTAGSGNLFDLDPTAIAWSQALFLTGAALVGGIAGLAHWSRRTWDAPSPEGPTRGAALATFLGAGLLATVELVQSIAARGDRGGLASEALGVLVAIGAALVALGLLVALSAVLGAARAGASSPDPDDPAGMTLEWFPTGPVRSGDPDAELPVVRSPYPVADLAGADQESS